METLNDNTADEGIGRKARLTRLYLDTFPAVAALVRKMGGGADDARDVFHDALIEYYEKTASADFAPRVNEQAYICGIARHLWLQRQRAAGREAGLDGRLENYMQIEKPEPEVSTHILHYLERAGKKCLGLLTAVYYHNSNMRELAKNFGFSGERSATVQKFKCLQKVREAVKQQSLRKEDFYV